MGLPKMELYIAPMTLAAANFGLCGSYVVGPNSHHGATANGAVKCR